MIVSFLQVLVVLFIIILLFGGGDRLKHALLELKSVFKSTNLTNSTELKNTEIKTIDKTESNSLKNKKEEDKNEDNIK